MRPMTAVVLGAGSRGAIYAGYALRHPEELKIMAVAEPRPDRLAKLADAHHIPQENRFAGWEELLERPKMADVAFVCTLDRVFTPPRLSRPWRRATTSCWRSP